MTTFQPEAVHRVAYKKMRAYGDSFEVIGRKLAPPGSPPIAAHEIQEKFSGVEQEVRNELANRGLFILKKNGFSDEMLRMFIDTVKNASVESLQPRTTAQKLVEGMRLGR